MPTFQCLAQSVKAFFPFAMFYVFHKEHKLIIKYLFGFSRFNPMLDQVFT